MRRIVLALGAVVTALTLTSCADTGVSASDAYKIGCPAVDSVLGGSTWPTTSRSPGSRRCATPGSSAPRLRAGWTRSSPRLESSDPKDMPADAKKIIVDGCEQNGYQLQNL